MTTKQQRTIAGMYLKYTGTIADMPTMLSWYTQIFLEV